MKRIILIISFLSFFLIEEGSGQNNLSISFGGGYVTSALDKTKLPYWEDGYLVNFSSDYKVTNKITLFLSSSFQSHYFNSNLVHIVWAQVDGYRFSISGENSSLVELSIGSRFYMTDTGFQPYIGAGAGLLMINQGKVEITSWMGGNLNRITSIFSDSNKNYNLTQINFSAGFEVAILNKIQLVLDGKSIRSFGGPSYFPLTASVKYNL